MTALLNTVNDVCRYTYCIYYVQNSRGTHPHNQHIQQLPETLITAVESRRAHNGHLSTATGNVVSAASKLSTFMQGQDLIVRVIIIEMSPCSESPGYERFAIML